MSLPPGWSPDERLDDHFDSTGSPPIPLHSSSTSPLSSFSLVSPEVEPADDSTIFEANCPSHKFPCPAEAEFEIISTTKPMKDPLYYLDTVIFEVCLEFLQSQMTDPLLRTVGGESVFCSLETSLSRIQHFPSLC